jgi:hypothetical protein
VAFAGEKYCVEVPLDQVRGQRWLTGGTACRIASSARPRWACQAAAARCSAVPR